MRGHLQNVSSKTENHKGFFVNRTTLSRFLSYKVSRLRSLLKFQDYAFLLASPNNCHGVSWVSTWLCLVVPVQTIRPRRGQTTPLMFHEGYICLVYIFLNQVWQMSFLCSPVYFNLEVVTKCQIMTSKLMTSPKRAITCKIWCKDYVIGKALTWGGTYRKPFFVMMIISWDMVN